MQKPRLQLLLPPSHRNKAIEGCHDQVGHLGQDRVLELLRDRFYWPGMYIDVASYLNSCPRCLRRKTQADQSSSTEHRGQPTIRTGPFGLFKNRAL